MAEGLSQRKLLRIAQAIHDQLVSMQVARYREVGRRLAHVADSYRQVQAGGRMLALSVARGWSAAAKHVAEQLGRAS
jgi:hypothetical protein